MFSSPKLPLLVAESGDNVFLSSLWKSGDMELSVRKIKLKLIYKYFMK